MKAPLALLLTSTAIVARADVYLSPEQAALTIFPTKQMLKREIALSEEQIKRIEKESSEAVRNKTIVAFLDSEKNVVFIDTVVGKHEFITIAVGISASGSIAGVEILEYRETYGYQVRNPEWRNQFSGKSSKDALKLETDIKNISGATLSSAHVTAGVRRLLHTYDTIRATL